MIYKSGTGQLGRFVTKGKGIVDDAMYAAHMEWASIGLPKGGIDKNKNVARLKSSGIYTGFHESGTNRSNADSTRKVRAILTKIYNYHHSK